MPRALNFSREEILQVAYNILIEEGMKSITARNIAKKPALPLSQYTQILNQCQI